MRTKVLFLSVLSLMAISVAVAQKENPRGLYKLQKFMYDDGSQKDPPFEQYKYCGDNVTLQLDVSEDIKAGIANFRMFNNDRVVLNYTGNVPVGEEGKGIQIFNSTKKNFTLRWYSRYTNHSLFPTDAFVNESYSSTQSISPLVAQAIKMLTTKEWKSKNKMVGVWRRRGYTKNAYGTGAVFEASEMYKIYSDKNVLIISGLRDSIPFMNGNVQFWPCTYLSNTAVQEYQNTCVVYWVNDDCFTLTWFNDGVPEIEVWDRCGLPKNMQELFGTSIDNSNCLQIIKPSYSDVVYKAEDVDIAPTPVIGYILPASRPDLAVAMGVRGTFVLSFVVEKNGMLTNGEIIDSKIECEERVSERVLSACVQALETEAIHSLLEMPLWNPGVKDGKYVRTRTHIPFILE